MAQIVDPNGIVIGDDGAGPGVRSSTGTDSAVAPAAAVASTPSPAPQNAAAAGKKNSAFTGLCEALNTHQRNLVKAGKYELADIYEIEFAPAEIGSSTVKKPGNSENSATPMQAPTANGSQLNSATNSVNTSGRSEPVLAGTQIIQFIDKVMRNSSYISDQQIYITDQVTGKQVPSANSKTGQMAWYKVNVTAIPLAGYDNKRHDHAYRMRYTISPFSIAQMQSEYFPQSRYRGVHKDYNYWFTGQNTQILDFQQDYNNLYRIVVSGLNVPVVDKQTSDTRNLTKKVFMPASGQSDQGATGGANEGPANAADSLYSPSDQAKIKLKIVGDPAWLQQGEASAGVSARNFNFAPFNADGAINYDAQEIVFRVSWNRPVDYNFDTGIADVTGQNLNKGTLNQPQESFTYSAIKCKSSFSKGRFEQELEGRLLVEYFDNLNPNTPSTTTPAAPVQATATATVPATVSNTINPTQNTDTNTLVDGGLDTSTSFIGA